MEQKYNILLSLKELEVIGAGLQNVAYQHASPLIRNIEEQINAQMQVEALVDEPKSGE